MDKKLLRLITPIFCCLLLILISGCVEEKQLKEVLAPATELDTPSGLPDWQDGKYHDYSGTLDLFNEFQIEYPELVNVFSIGNSVLGKDMWCIRITNEKNKTRKSSCLIDGCIHGEEWEAGEACLYLAEYLLINFDANATIAQMLNSSEVYILPFVNPDARQADCRYNANGIDLSRNFDIDFGRIRGTAIPLGVLFGRIKIPYIDTSRLHERFPNSIPWRLFNCGRHPFSEPETQALRDLMTELDKNEFSFYVNCHTAWHTFGSPWIAYKPPFEMSTQEQYILDYAKEWVDEHTEYEHEDIDLYNKVSGDSADWCFKEFRIPAFGFEILSIDYDAFSGEKKHDHLVHWMKTTLPVFMYLLVNINNLRQWETPDIQPSLPQGVPPEPLQYSLGI